MEGLRVSEHSSESARGASPASRSSGLAALHVSAFHAYGTRNRVSPPARVAGRLSVMIFNLGRELRVEQSRSRVDELAKARAEGYAFTGTCIQTDADGDKLFMTYEGPESGRVEWIGGTGKYSDIAGSGTWSVADAPGNTSSLFTFTLSYDVNWTQKEK